MRRPAAPRKRVDRPHLTKRLQAGLDSGRHVTLISAPAGFGKTTCVAAWLDTLTYPVAWLSLDAADDDPGRFFTYLIAALQQVAGRLGGEIEGLLRAGQTPPGDVVAAVLVNDLLGFEGQLLLVLDDLHLIQDRAILRVLDSLLANLPPALHLVLITREDPPLPLARLRANNQLTEIRAGDLRLTSHEAGRFLDEVMGLSLSPADVAALDDKTEGWLAGLQLAAIAARPLGTTTSSPDGTALSRFIAALSGSHRFILSYLTTEVLDRQPAEIRDFLLQTAILGRLCGDLCNAVTGRTDGQLMLERLFGANLFLISLDDEQHWYRYHHLFADLLRNRQKALQPERAAELHRRASHWYVQADPPGMFVDEAVRHSLAAADYALAVSLVESQAMSLIMQGYIKTVAGWMQAIPPAWSSHSVKANLAFAWMHFLRGTMTQATPYLEQLQMIFAAWPPEPQAAEQPDPSLQAQWLALQATVCNSQGRPADSLALAHQALDIVPEADHYAQSLIYLSLSGAYQQMDDHVQAMASFRKMVHHGRAAANLVVEILGTAGLAAMAIRHGQLHLAYDIAAQGVERVQRSGSLPPISATLYGTLGQVCYHWNQLEQAHRHYSRATQVSALSGYGDAEIIYHVLLSRLHQAEGSLEAAGCEMQAATRLLSQGAATWVRPEVIAQQVRLFLARDDPAAAEALLIQSGVSLQDEITYQTDALHLAHLRLLLYRSQEPHSAALRQGSVLAGRIIASAQAGQRVETELQALILAALLQASAGDMTTGLDLMDRALALAKPEGYVRVFLEEGASLATLLRHTEGQGMHLTCVNSLLALLTPAGEQDRPLASGQPTDLAGEVPAEPLVEPLTRRELQVLRLVADGCSNQEIATRLVITLYTVKKHISNILAKLEVTSRTQAVARARQLRLL